MVKIQDFDLRLTPHKHNGVIYVNLPKKFCDLCNICADGEEIRLVVHQKITKEGKIIEICDLKVKVE